MNSIPALFLAFAYIVNNIVTTNGAAWKITLFKTKIPTYNREQPTVPRKPSDYCMKGLCPRGTPHICCNYPFWDEQCPKPHFGINMEVYGSQILANHNLMRVSLLDVPKNLPTASFLPILRWDDELAMVAMRVTNYCNSEKYTKCLNVPRFLNVAHTSYTYTVSTPKPSHYLNAANKYFTSSINDFPPEYVSSYQESDNEMHKVFANIAFHKNTRMGCGFLVHQSADNYTVYMTCLYNEKIKPMEKLYDIEPPKKKAEN